MSDETISELDELRARVRASEGLLMELFLWFEKNFRTGLPIPSLSWRENGGLREAVERFAAYGPAEFAAMLAAQRPERTDAPGLDRDRTVAAETFRASTEIRRGEVVVSDGAGFVAPLDPASSLPPLGFARNAATAGGLVNIEMRNMSPKDLALDSVFQKVPQR